MFCSSFSSIWTWIIQTSLEQVQSLQRVIQKELELILYRQEWIESVERHYSTW